MFVVKFGVCGGWLGLMSGVLGRWRSGDYLGGVWEKSVDWGEGNSGVGCVGFTGGVSGDLRVIWDGFGGGMAGKWWEGIAGLLGEFGESIRREIEAWKGAGLLEKKEEVLLKMVEGIGEGIAGEMPWNWGLSPGCRGGHSDHSLWPLFLLEKGGGREEEEGYFKWKKWMELLLELGSLRLLTAGLSLMVSR